MKTFLLITLTALLMNAFAEDKWTIVAKAIDCGEEFSVKAKEGVPFVMIGSEKILSKKGKPFSFSSPDANTFENGRYLFRMPGMVENGVPKLDVKVGSKSLRCNMKAFRK